MLIERMRKRLMPTSGALDFTSCAQHDDAPPALHPPG
jgi:hypothetical protein